PMIRISALPQFSRGLSAFAESRGLADFRGLSMALALGALVGAANLGCDDDKKSAEPETPAAPAETAEPVAAAPKGPPEFSVDEVSPRVGFARAVVFKPDGKPNPDGL